MENTNPTPLRSAELVTDSGYTISVSFDKNGKLSDIAVFDGQELLMSETREVAEKVMEAIDFALGFNYPKEK